MGECSGFPVYLNVYDLDDSIFLISGNTINLFSFINSERSFLLDRTWCVSFWCRIQWKWFCLFTLFIVI